MKKEIIFAIFLGLSLGLIITYGVYRAKTTLQQPVSNNEEIKPDATPIASAESTLSITSPEDEIITDNQQLTITGTTTPNSFVVIFVNDNDTITTSDGTGNFSIEAELETGSNIILIHSLDEDGDSTIQERTVIYSTIKLIEEPAQASQSGETDEQ